MWWNKPGNEDVCNAIYPVIVTLNKICLMKFCSCVFKLFPIDKYSPMVSRLLHLMIIDILATAVALRIGSATLQPMLSEMRQNLRSKRYT